MRRVGEITSDPVLSLTVSSEKSDPRFMDPDQWVTSRLAANTFVSTAEIKNAIIRVERGVTEELETLTLNEDYLQSTGRVAQLRVIQAGYRLADVLREGVSVDW
jgi:hypothetical protein